MIGPTIEQGKHQNNDIFSEWREIFEFNAKMEFRVASIFWLLITEDKVLKAIESIKTTFATPSENIHYFNIIDLHSKAIFEQFLLDINLDSQSSEPIIIIAQNFENYTVKITDKEALMRSGHDWDQDIAENRTLLEKFSGKNLVIFTTVIRTPKNSVQYENAVKGSIGSQYQEGWVEIT